MNHQINGLDLLYIVMFGSKPYTVVINGNIQQATKEQIFSVENTVLAYRHADPAAAMGSYGAVFNGRHVDYFISFRDLLIVIRIFMQIKVSILFKNK
jgi:hypothetical protein